MTSAICWRCSSKARIPLFSPTPAYHSASFTTSASVQRNPAVPSKKSTPKVLSNSSKTGSKKGEKATYLKKKVSVTPRSKKTDIGERAALRKRIILSNNNAIAVEGIPEFGLQSLGDEQLHGQVVSLTVSMVNQLRTVNAFKRTQNWGLFRNPTMLVRRETVEYGRLFKEMSEEQEARRTIRRILVGERGSGKSIILLQAMAMAFLKGWVVINLSEAQDIVLDHTEYGPIPGTSPPLYQQKVYTASLLSAIAQANPILSTLTLKVPPPRTPHPIQPSITLDRFALLGAADPEIAYDVFITLVQDLLLPSRPPLLLCIDSLAHAMKLSAYRDAAFTLIHAHDLAILKWFMSHLSGASELPNGGMVLAAVSESNSPRNLSLDTALQELESSQSQTSDGDQETKAEDVSESNSLPKPSLNTAPQELESSQSQAANVKQEIKDQDTSESNPSPTSSSLSPAPYQHQVKLLKPQLSQPLPLYQQTKEKTFSYHPGRHNPFINYDQRVLDVFSRPGMEIQRLKGLTKAEARGLMDFWAKSGLVRQTVNETLLGEKWALSGGGVVGELERATLTMKI